MTDARSIQGPEPGTAVAPAEIDASCRLPLLVLFISAALWLVIGSVFCLIASIKFHSPNFLAQTAWLTYGRVRPCYLDSFLYGFGLQAGLGVALWLLARLGRTRLAWSWPITIGAAFWNLGVTIGMFGVLAGDSTGFEYFELPAYASALMFPGYLLAAIGGLLTFHQRNENRLFVSQWFLVAALFWFPWIYSTATLLLIVSPVRGVAQALVGWWYSENLLVVWLSLSGIGTGFYLLSKILNRPLHSHYLALFAFWTLILFGSCAGVPASAPVPAWMPALSTVATVLTAVPWLAVVVTVLQTLRSPQDKSQLEGPATRRPLYFVLFGFAAFALAGLMRIPMAPLDPTLGLHFTWFATAERLLHLYGFFTMIMVGALYYILPRLTGAEFPYPKLVRAHFWLAAAGVALLVLPEAAAGISQAMQLKDAAVPFQTIMQSMLHYLRVSTLGDCLLLAGHCIFFVNLAALAICFYRMRLGQAYERATVDLFQAAEVKP
jgi:cytochrome c oxidase cbb3-type subunit I